MTSRRFDFNPFKSPASSRSLLRHDLITAVSGVLIARGGIPRGLPEHSVLFGRQTGRFLRATAVVCPDAKTEEIAAKPASTELIAHRCRQPDVQLS